MTDRELMQQALDALVEIHPGNMTPMAEESWNKAIEALRARLAQPELAEIEKAMLGVWQDVGDPRFPHIKAQPEPAKLWLWKNFVDGRPEYWAFDNPYPTNLEDGDPQTLGQPCGYAIFKPSRDGSNGRTEEQVLREMASVKSKPQLEPEPVAWVENLTDAQPHAVTDLKYCSVAQHERGEHLKYIPLYADPTPCQTCEALARTVMMDQTSHDTAPPQREWQGLTGQETNHLLAANVDCAEKLIRAIEAKLKEKNNAN